MRVRRSRMRSCIADKAGRGRGMDGRGYGLFPIEIARIGDVAGLFVQRCAVPGHDDAQFRRIVRGIVFSAEQPHGLEKERSAVARITAQLQAVRQRGRGGKRTGNGLGRRGYAICDGQKDLHCRAAAIQAAQVVRAHGQPLRTVRGPTRDGIGRKPARLEFLPQLRKEALWRKQQDRALCGQTAQRRKRFACKAVFRRFERAADLLNVLLLRLIAGFRHGEGRDRRFRGAAADAPEREQNRRHDEQGAFGGQSGGESRRIAAVPKRAEQPGSVLSELRLGRRKLCIQRRAVGECSIDRLFVRLFFRGGRERGQTGDPLLFRRRRIREQRPCLKRIGKGRQSAAALLSVGVSLCGGLIHGACPSPLPPACGRQPRGSRSKPRPCRPACRPQPWPRCIRAGFHRDGSPRPQASRSLRRPDRP